MDGRETKMELTVYTQTNTIPRNTAKNTHPVHTFVLSPLNKLAERTAAITIVWRAVSPVKEVNRR
jgi:hypothetical protein